MESMALLKDMSEKEVEALAEREAMMCSSCHVEPSSRVIVFDFCKRAQAKGLCDECEQELMEEIQAVFDGKLTIQ